MAIRQWQWRGGRRGRARHGRRARVAAQHAPASCSTRSSRSSAVARGGEAVAMEVGQQHPVSTHGDVRPAQPRAPPSASARARTRAHAHAPHTHMHAHARTRAGTLRRAPPPALRSCCCTALAWGPGTSRSGTEVGPSASPAGSSVCPCSHAPQALAFCLLWAQKNMGALAADGYHVWAVDLLGQGAALLALPRASHPTGRCGACACTHSVCHALRLSSSGAGAHCTGACRQQLARAPAAGGARPAARVLH